MAELPERVYDTGECFAMDVSYPSMLHACHESRVIALEHYRLSFSAHLRHPVYFDFSQDTLWMRTMHALERFFTGAKAPIVSEIGMVRTITVDPLPIYQNRLVANSGRLLHSLASANQPDISSPFYGLSLLAASNGLSDAVGRFGNLREIVVLTPKNDIVENQRFYGQIFSITRVRGNPGVHIGALSRWDIAHHVGAFNDVNANYPVLTMSSMEDFRARFS